MKMAFLEWKKYFNTANIEDWLAQMNKHIDFIIVILHIIWKGANLYKLLLK
jgi:hypothetical protein